VHHASMKTEEQWDLGKRIGWTQEYGI